MAPGAHRLDDMEAVRGIAALGVVVYHFLHGFVPPVQVQALRGESGWLVVERPMLLALINGPFMVSIFFVLSSYVLTVRLVREPNLSAAVVAIVKRFPRLLPLTVVGSVVPAVLFHFGLMANDDVAAAINSTWLSLSGGVKAGPAMPPPSIAGSFVDSFVLFWRGWSQYNSALWTMKYELVGSIFALLTAMAIGARPRLRTDAAVVLAIGVAGLWIHALVSICVATVFLVKYVCRPGFTLPRNVSVWFIVLGLVLGSTYKSLPEELLQEEWIRGHVIRADWIIHGLGAMLIVLGVRGWTGSPLQRLPLGRWLGRLSFPMYVLHLPVFASVASLIILQLGYGIVSVTLAFIAGMGVLLAAAVPVAWLDEWWVARLNAATRALASRPGNAAAMGGRMPE